MLNRRLRLARAHFPSGATGRRLFSEHFSLLTGLSTRGGAAAVISKKVARRAVDRHLLKRRMLALMRPYVREDRYLIAYARTGSARLPFLALKEELTRLLQSAIH